MTPEEQREFCDFYIYIGDENKVCGFVIEASSYKGSIAYRSIQYAENLQQFKDMLRYKRQTRHYLGPDFFTMDRKLQLAFTEYLECFGINNYLAAFVEGLSLDKD